MITPNSVMRGWTSANFFCTKNLATLSTEPITTNPQTATPIPPNAPAVIY